MAKIEVVRGSLLDQNVDAIVNAANTSMRGGGGIDGAVHRKAGPELIQELMRVAPHGTKTGKVVVTPGFGTGFQYVLHVAGPFWSGGQRGEEEALRECYANAALKAIELGVRGIGFCGISTGIYRFPLEKAAPIAISAVAESTANSSLEQVVFAMFQEDEFQVFRDTLDQFLDLPMP